LHSPSVAIRCPRAFAFGPWHTYLRLRLRLRLRHRLDVDVDVDAAQDVTRQLLGQLPDAATHRGLRSVAREIPERFLQHERVSAYAEPWYEAAARFVKRHVLLLALIGAYVAM
jgi:hypothetical protein